MFSWHKKQKSASLASPVLRTTQKQKSASVASPVLRTTQKQKQNKSARLRSRLLRCAATILEEQRDVADPRFMANAMHVTRSAAEFARDVEKHEQWRTMPVTNTRERGQAKPNNVIGYKYIARH